MQYRGNNLKRFIFFFTVSFFTIIGIHIYQTSQISLMSSLANVPSEASSNTNNTNDSAANMLDSSPVARVGTNRFDDSSIITTEQKVNINLSSLPKILIYHSHNRESWLPELKNDVQSADQAFDPKLNVTLLGDKLKTQLQKKIKDIPVIHSKKDYPTVIGSFNYAKSYTYSKATIKEELKLHENIGYLIDLHRDSQKREKTTIRFQNLDYAQVYFVVGTNNPNWQRNMKFAEQIQDGLNAKIPNVSKGIYKKGNESGNGEYNQSLSANSALIEIGGVENNLEESYRTIELLAGVIQNIWVEDTEHKRIDS
ncbi:stage II sporulation protein P [Paenibacillus sp. MMO-58]|uniref:stage II sporulation protein P n=1 Tax=Paenibacillus sp. MMO-58 TaxID=3081290 RepID=UPI00301925BF